MRKAAATLSQRDDLFASCTFLRASYSLPGMCSIMSSPCCSASTHARASHAPAVAPDVGYPSLVEMPRAESSHLHLAVTMAVTQ